MRNLQTSEQTRPEEPNHRTDDVNGNPKTTQIESAPLYASPWLALYYVIREGWDQRRP
jgi:hypothetical protein